MLLISLFDARGTYIDNYGIFIDLRMIEFNDSNIVYGLFQAMNHQLPIFVDYYFKSQFIIKVRVCNSYQTANEPT